MKSYGTVQGAMPPEPLVIDDYSVWKNSNIREITVTDPMTEEERTEYQYEVKTKDGFLFVKPDPYTMRFGKERENMSAVYVEPSFPWTDEKWMQERKTFRKHDAKLTICELSLEKYDADHGGGHNYETLAPLVADYLQESGFNTVELMPVMEHVPEDPYAITGYYAVCERFGTADQFKAFVNLLHEAGIRVVMEIDINQIVIFIFPELLQ